MGANIPSPDDFGKRLLHGACGAALGFFAGMLVGRRLHANDFLLWWGLAGALILGFLAFKYTDDFWSGGGAN